MFCSSRSGYKLFIGDIARSENMRCPEDVKEAIPRWLTNAFREHFDQRPSDIDPKTPPSTGSTQTV